MAVNIRGTNLDRLAMSADDFTQEGTELFTTLNSSIVALGNNTVSIKGNDLLSKPDGIILAVEVSPFLMIGDTHRTAELLGNILLLPKGDTHDIGLELEVILTRHATRTGILADSDMITLVLIVVDRTVLYTFQNILIFIKYLVKDLLLGIFIAQSGFQVVLVDIQLFGKLTDTTLKTLGRLQKDVLLTVCERFQIHNLLLCFAYLGKQAVILLTLHLVGKVAVTLNDRLNNFTLCSCEGRWTVFLRHSPVMLLHLTVSLVILLRTHEEEAIAILIAINTCLIIGILNILHDILISIIEEYLNLGIVVNQGRIIMRPPMNMTIIILRHTINLDGNNLTVRRNGNQRAGTHLGLLPGRDNTVSIEADYFIGKILRICHIIKVSPFLMISDTHRTAKFLGDILLLTKGDTHDIRLELEMILTRHATRTGILTDSDMIRFVPFLPDGVDNIHSLGIQGSEAVRFHDILHLVIVFQAVRQGTAANMELAVTDIGIADINFLASHGVVDKLQGLAGSQDKVNAAVRQRNRFLRANNGSRDLTCGSNNLTVSRNILCCLGKAATTLHGTHVTT